MYLLLIIEITNVEKNQVSLHLDLYQDSRENIFNHEKY